jgi:hypothetical protein
MSNDHRLLAAFAKGRLTCKIIMLCPVSDEHVSVHQWEHVMDIPTLWICTCGDDHQFSNDDSEIQFRRP